MAYVTESYYTSTYFGTSAGTDFNRLAARASDDITAQCPIQNKDATGEVLDLSLLTIRQLALLQKATCAQIEWYVNNGDDYNDGGQVGSFQIGAYSQQKNLTQQRAAGALSPRAQAYLEQSGLMSRAAHAFYPQESDRE